VSLGQGGTAEAVPFVKSIFPSEQAGRDSAFPGKVRGTADPSATLGMTKERVVERERTVAKG
jgi:hypothetical protein